MRNSKNHYKIDIYKDLYIARKRGNSVPWTAKLAIPSKHVRKLERLTGIIRKGFFRVSNKKMDGR